MPGPVIDVDCLSFAYPDGTRALDRVSFQVAAGERVALAGGNGAGKSTLLLHLAGVLDFGHVHGAARVAGLAVEKGNLRRIRRSLGLVFQNPDDQLFCPTIFEDVAFGPRNLGLPADEVSRRVSAALAEVGLAGFERRSPHHLSLGERKRAALATVLAMRPPILALDEPTSMLDGRGRRQTADLLACFDATLLIVTHDLEMIRRLCSRVIVLSSGKVAAAGDPASVLADQAFLESHGLA
jgi:cobalt/nickel transport system ATP-binding protein